jgi:hypothetical protein
MISPVRLVVACACASVLGVGTLASAADNTLEIVVGSGPSAGTYKVPAAETLCMHLTTQKHFNVVYKDFDAKDPKKIATAGIHIINPDDAGLKKGTVLVNFGPGGRNYTIEIPGSGTGLITLIRKSKTAADMGFQGKTKDGIAIQVTAKCLDVEEL